MDWSNSTTAWPDVSFSPSTSSFGITVTTILGRAACWCCCNSTSAIGLRNCSITRSDAHLRNSGNTWSLKCYQNLTAVIVLCLSYLYKKFNIRVSVFIRHDSFFFYVFKLCVLFYPWSSTSSGKTKKMEEKLLSSLRLSSLTPKEVLFPSPSPPFAAVKAVFCSVCVSWVRLKVGPGDSHSPVLWFRHRWRAALDLTDTKWKTGVSL